MLSVCAAHSDAPLSARLVFALALSLLCYLTVASPQSPPHSRPPHVRPLQLLPQSVRLDHRYVSSHPDLVIDTQQPAFDWQLDDELDAASLSPLRNVSQSAYRLIVSRASDGTVQWDSERVPSSKSVHVVYSGPSFASDSSYRYSLMYWSTTGRTSGWVSGGFRTGLLDRAHWHGQWIGSDALNMNQLRRTFTLPTDAARATIFYSGVGYSELWLDGEKVDPSRVLDPGWTQYYRRCLYVSFELTHRLTAGSHALGVVLGDGWYSRQPQLLSDGDTSLLPANVSYGPPRVLVQLNVQLNDGSNYTLVSDRQWLGRSGPTVAAGVYQGSVRDMRLERDGWATVGFEDAISRWLPADVLASPLGWGGKLSLQFMDPIRAGPDALHVRTKAGHVGATIGVPITQTVLHPMSETEWDSGNLFDLGQNMVGWCTANVSHLRGSSVYVRYAEYKMQPPQPAPMLATSSVDIDTTNLRYIAVEDVYIVNGTAGWELLEPQFTYRGFRYVWLASNYRPYPASAISCPVVHSEGSLVGSFSSSSAVINQIQQNILWTQIGNTMSLMTDCPQRNERKGWLGDASGSADLSMNFDFANVYRNHLNLIADEQFVNGGVPVTIPISCCPTPDGAPSGDPNWTTAFAWITWMLYEHYGDTSTMATHYDGIAALFNLVFTDWYPQHGLRGMIVQFGDWYAQPDGGTDNALVSSFAFLRDCYVLMQMSVVLNKTDRAAFYNSTYSSLAREFHATWYDNSTGGYSNNAQTANALALALPDVVPDSLRASVAKQLAQDIQLKGHMTCGIIGAAQLLPVLSSHGYHHVAVSLASSTSYPSWGWTFTNEWENGTTLWESFGAGHDGGAASHNHHMFSPIGSWFYRYLAGISFHGGLDAPIQVRPRLQHDHRQLSWVQAEVDTPKGRVEVRWQSDWQHSSLTMTVSVPSNCQARVTIEPPVQSAMWTSVVVDGQRLFGSSHHAARAWHGTMEGVRWEVQEESGMFEMEVGSGSFAFVGQWR